MAAAILRRQRPVLEFLHAQGSPWMLMGLRMAAATGNIPLLEWMRQQDPPFPWDSSVCTVAQNKSRTLHWLLSNHPQHPEPGPCPWTQKEVARYPKVLARLADISLMQRLQLNLQEMPVLGVLAAEQRQLGLLKWLAQQQPPCPLTPEICEIAVANNDVEMVHYLVAEHEPPLFPGIIKGVSDACRLELAKAACPMPAHEACKIYLLVEPWFTFMGLHRRAAKQMLLSQRLSRHRLPEVKAFPSLLRAPGHRFDADLGEIIWRRRQFPITRHLRSAMLPAEGLLAELARLPEELADKIASEAFLSPSHAAKIMFSAPQRRPRDFYYSSDDWCLTDGSDMEGSDMAD